MAQGNNRYQRNVTPRQAGVTAVTAGSSNTTNTRANLARSLKSSQAVIEEILDEAQGDYNNYPNIRRIASGNMQYVPDPTIQWNSDVALQNEISAAAKKRAIDAEEGRAERIANAVGSAVIIFPTSGKAQLAVLTICLGSVVLLFTRRPWSDEGFFTLKGFTDSFVYALIPVTLVFIYLTMRTSQATAQGQALLDTGTLPTPIKGLLI